MGDGRYYTFNQFITTIILVFLIIFITISLVLSYYRNADKKSDKYLVVMFVWLELVAVLKFIEELFMFENTGLILRFIQIAVIMVSYINFALYLTAYFPSSKYGIKKSIKTIILVCVFMSAALFIICGMCSNFSFIFKFYSAGYVMYSTTYTFILICLAAIIIFTMLWIYVKAKRNNTLDRIKFTLSLISVMYVFPLVVYIIASIKLSIFVNEIELGIVFLATVTMNIVQFDVFNAMPIVLLFYFV